MTLTREIVSRFLMAASGQQHHSARCFDHDGLQLLLEKANKLLESESRGKAPVPENTHQCKLLAEKLVRTLNLVMRTNICDHERLFQELQAIFNCAAALIDLCRSHHSQPYNLISLSQSREAFAVILSKLTWYATAFLVRRDFLGMLSQTLTDIWRLELREAAREDFRMQAKWKRPILMEISKSDIHVDYGRMKGKGTFGRVFEAKWLGEWPCAVKEFYDGTCRTEAAVLASLHHPNIVQIYGTLDESALVMELMDFDLTSLFQSELGLDLILAVDIMLQTAEGMRYLHDANIVHMDLKAANILIKKYAGGSYLVKLTDFGLARTKVNFVERLGSYKVGTPKWRAPELLERISEDHLITDPIVFPKPADVYSFGITCSEILTGKSPHADLENAVTEIPKTVLLEKILQGQRPLLPSHCPARLVALIEQCWNRNPDRRPSFNYICAVLKQIKASLLTEQHFAIRRRRRRRTRTTAFENAPQAHEAHNFYRTVGYSALPL